MNRMLMLVMLMAVVPSLARAQANALYPEIQPHSADLSQYSSNRKPSSQQFQWTEPTPRLSTECDGKIAMVVDQPLTENGLPNAPSAYKPLSKHCKFEAFRRQTYSPSTFVSAGYEATWAHMWGQWSQYGGGMEGWGKRFGATLADTESRRFIQAFLLSTLLHQDPRYFASGRKNIFSRGWYAATRVIKTRNDEGQIELNTSELLGAFFTSSLQNAYYPQCDRSFVHTLNRFTGALSSDAISDLLHEFAPDMKHLFHRHAPKKIQELEQKIPIPDDAKP